MTMTFEELLDEVLALLQRRSRVAYRAVQRQFDLDDAALADVKEALLYAHPDLVTDDGRGLVWTGAADSIPTPTTRPPEAAPASAADAVAVQARTHDTAPRAYTPPHLTDKILAARPALAGERKQVTVLFADLKDSTELVRGLDPEAAQQLVDPALHYMMDAVHRFEGTVNQVLGDGIMALFGAPSPMKTTPCAPAMPPWRCRRPCGPTLRKDAAPVAWSCVCASA